MRRAAAQRAGARIEHSVDRNAAIVSPVFRVLLLHLVRRVVPDEKVPPHRVVLAGEAVERRHVVIVGQAVDAGLVVIGARELPRIAAGLQQQHRAPRLGQPRGKRSAPGAGADDDVIERAAARSLDFSGHSSSHPALDLAHRAALGTRRHCGRAGRRIALGESCPAGRRAPRDVAVRTSSGRRSAPSCRRRRAGSRSNGRG